MEIVRDVAPSTAARFSLPLHLRPLLRREVIESGIVPNQVLIALPELLRFQVAPDVPLANDIRFLFELINQFNETALNLLLL
ncbi:MAG TPA: hypothetical protein VNH83_25980, partial [Bryobacteraceae bacterium]|nr:hypothetical protein [Bryobacteraceae bacterium]